MFGLPQVQDFYTRTKSAMAGAQGAAGEMMDKYNTDTRNALSAQRMALDEAYLRDQLAQRQYEFESNRDYNDRRLEANEPGFGDRILGGLGGAFTGYMMGSVLGGEGGSDMWGYAGAGLGALGGLL
jgi:hypothetical protein